MHESVALDRSIELLEPAILKSENPILVDATLGLGGHSFALLERFPNLKIIGIDRDKSAIAEAKSRLANFGDRIQIAHSVFDKITEVVNGFGYQKIDGALFDLGVSSMQLDQPIRGFSYSQEAPLDMRMDQSRGITADEIVNTWDKNEIVRILRNFGEEKFAPRIVDSIIAARPIKSTSQLAEIVKKAIPAATRRTGGNPATAGTAATGGGGGGGYGNSNTGAAGGSGVVILRYVGTQRGTGGTVTSSGGYTYHTFTSSGSITF